MKTFIFVNQSCYRRQEEIARVRRFLFINGFAEDTDLAKTDLAIFFTCAFSQSRVVDMLNEIGRIRSAIREGCELIVGSCLPETGGDELSKVFRGKTITPKDFGALNQLPGITVKIEEIPDLFGKDTVCAPAVRPPSSNTALLDIPLVGVATRLGTDKRMGVFIASGCLRRCSYCAIRFATGKLRSKPLDVVSRTFSEGLERGYRKFEIYADSLGDYGLDIGTNLGELFDWLLRNDQKFTVGIYDLHPQAFLKYFDVILSLCQAGKVHYLYVPIQSGNARILKRMNRPCDVEALARKLLMVKGQTNVFLQTGIIVGFPGETDEEFEDTLLVLKAVHFSDVYVHFYSDMPNTESSKMSNKISKDIMLRRLERLEEAGIIHNGEKTRHEWANIAIPSSSSPAPMIKSSPVIAIQP